MIRPARPADIPAIAAMIRELAEYEHLSQEVILDEAKLREHLFGDREFASVLIAEESSAVVAFALYFYNYSTFLGRPGIHLEDLFVRPAARGHGHGKALLAKLASIAVAAGCGRLEWSVLDWNAPSIAFYQKLGAQPLDDWTTFRLTGETLKKRRPHGRRRKITSSRG